MDETVRLGGFLIRKIYHALLCAIMVLNMCLLGMFLAQWQACGSFREVFRQNLHILFQFLGEYAIILK